jgi:RNA polymerase sigma factor (sigma-70 family)
MDPSDETLLQACRRGDESAWELLIQRYQRLVYTIPRRAGLDEDSSVEVLQEVFATLVEKLDEIEQPARLHAWLITTARRATWRVGRRMRASVALPGDRDAPFEVPDGAPPPDEALMDLEEQHLVRTAVESLDQRCRTLLLLLYYQPQTPSYAEIAARLGTTESSIGPRRSRCLDKLERVLRRLGVVSLYCLLLRGMDEAMERSPMLLAMLV